MIIKLKLGLYGDVLHSLYELARYGLVSGLRRLITTSEKSQRDQKNIAFGKFRGQFYFKNVD